MFRCNIPQTPNLKLTVISLDNMSPSCVYGITCCMDDDFYYNVLL